jgi:MFS family permease
MAIWLLARLTLIGDSVPSYHRGKALSTMGGLQRMAGLLGPVSTGFIAVNYGYSTVLMTVAIVSGITLILVCFTIRAPKTEIPIHRPAIDDHLLREGLAQIGVLLRRHKKVYMTAGLAVLLLTLVRSARQLLIPLWGAHISLDPSAIGLVGGTAALIDTCLFPVAGYLMDRYGRKYAAIPCLLLLSSALLLIPLSHNATQLTLIAMLAGLGNGLGSGINMTLGTDLAPQGERAPFLGVWRLISDTGSFSGPVLIGLITTATTLAGALASSALLGLIGLCVMTFSVKETLQRDTK